MRKILISGGSTSLGEAIRKQITYRHINVGEVGRSSFAIVALENISDYTPHYAKKNKRGKFKRKGSK